MAEITASDTLQPAASEPRRRRLEIWLPLAIVIFDQITKALIRQMVPLHESVTVIPGFLDITHVRNTGAAFGILNSVDFPFKVVVIPVIAAAALIAVGMYSASLAHHQFIARLGLALIIGGAAGNLLDRMVVGSVVDFVDNNIFNQFSFYKCSNPIVLPRQSTTVFQFQIITRIGKFEDDTRSSKSMDSRIVHG